MSIKLGYPINAKSQRFLQNVTFWIRTRTEMTILNVIEKRQKSPFLPSALLQKSSLQKPKACHRSQWNSVLVQAWKWLFCSYSFPWPKPLVQCILALPRFSTSRLHCALRKSQNFWRRSFLPPFFFHIYADTSTFHGNFALVVIFIGRKFQNLKCLGKKFISSRVPKLIRFGAAILISSSTSKKPNSPTKKI